MFRKPEAAKQGSRVGVFLPASAAKEPFLTRGVQVLKTLGFEAENRLPEKSEGFLAASTMESYEILKKLYIDPNVDILWAGRGGYGSNLLLPHLESLCVERPKIVIGSSDVSCLLWFLLDRLNMVVFYGPMVYTTLAEGRFFRSHLLKILTGNYREISYRGQVLCPGTAEAILTGGCLSNFVSLIGTPFFPTIEGRILLLEDVNERPYRLDRMFWQAAEAGVFKSVSALILGQFPGCFRSASEKGWFLERWRSIWSGLGIPVIAGLPFGHSRRCSTLPLGVNGIIDTSLFPGLILKEKGVEP